MNLYCTRYTLVPLFKKITSLNNTKVVWQDTPPYPGRNPLNNGYIKLNSFVQAAINYYIGNELRQVGVMSVPAWGLAMPWSEEQLSGRHHLVSITNGMFKVVPAGHISTYAVMDLACRT